MATLKGPQPTDELPSPAALPPIRLGRTLRLGIRAAWDSLGFVCAASLTLFAALVIPLSLLSSAIRLRTPVGALGSLLSIAMLLLVVPPIFGGICWLAYKVYERDEPSYMDIWRGARRLYWRAVALGTIQLLIKSLLAANLFFYAARGTILSLLAAIAILYIAIFFAMNAIYHWPLLIAGEAGIIKRESGGKAGLRSVFRNGFLMAVSAPGYSVTVTAVLISITLPLIVSGVGLALLAPGTAAFLMTRAVRDQLVRFGSLPEEPDPDDPISEDRWRIE